MRYPKRVLRALAFFLGTLTAASAIPQGYRIERIASGLNQPTYVTQAPNDPANIIYFTERTRDANPGFGAANTMGRVWRYDINTRTRTQVLDLSQYFVTNDTGLQTIAFHPDFNTPETPGYGKLYVSHAEAQASPSGTARNRVEEYTVNLGGPNPTYAASFSRRLLQYDNNTENNHTINWIGFDPTATGDARNHLYVSTGDGSFGNTYAGGTSPNGRPSQNPNDIAGKMLRINVVGPDAYPFDALKNFAIPQSNPIPTYNAANPGTPISGLGEVYLTGLRNVYRASFDRANGDLWMGDVGETFVEEVSFLKAGSNVAGPPVDYGWPQLEGTVPSNINGAPHGPMNPFTGVTSLNPIQQFQHDGGGEAVIGGYAYRGPVPELQGKYFYSDFVTTGNANQVWMLEFNRDTNSATFNGNNGTRTDVSTLWQSLVYDPTNPTYMPNSTTGSSAGLDHIVSFGEDNAGNLYIVDFGNGSGFNGQYPGAGLGEIFRLVPSAEIKITVNRTTGEMIFSNGAGIATDIRGYTILSASGGIAAGTLTPITDRLDAPPSGDGSIDPNNVWEITSDTGDRDEFSEQSTGGAASLSAAEQFTLSPAGGWTRSIYEDFQLSVVLGSGTTAPAVVEFIGNGGQPFGRSDLNFNGMLDPADWPLFRTRHLQSLSGLTRAQSYQLGDLDGDGDNDFADFRLFQTDYIAANGQVAFEALLSVPEPSAVVLALVGMGVAVFCRRRSVRMRPAWLSCSQFALASAATPNSRRLTADAALRPTLIATVIVIAWQVFTFPAEAALRHRYSFNEGVAANAMGRTIIDAIGGANGTVRGEGSSATASQLILPGGSSNSAAYVDLPNGIISNLSDATFEAWYTIDTTENWARIFDFGSTTGGELAGPGGGGEGQDYIFYAPMRGTNIDSQRVEVRNNDSLFGPGGSAGVVGATNTMDPEFNHTLDVQYHVALVFDADGGNDLGEATMTLYINGALPPGEAANPMETMVQLRNLNDVNNWLGRSNWTNDANFDGSFNEFRIYDEALSADRIAANTSAGPDVTPVLEIISLEVNTVTGSVTIKNSVQTPTKIDYYTITSAEGALAPAGWNSLADQNIDAVGAGEGQSWDEAEESDEFALTELFLLGASSVSSVLPLGLGQALDVSVFGAGEEADLQFKYARQGSTQLLSGMVSYVTPEPLPGDYNHNGTVDAVDYVVWRDTLGSMAALDADGDGDGTVDQDDYSVWRANFGNTFAAAANIQTHSVPESASVALLMIGCICQARSRGTRSISKRRSPRNSHQLMELCLR